MRTAKQIFKGYRRLIDSDVSAYWCTEKDFIEAINEARKEAFKKSAEQIHGTVYNGNGDEMQDYYKGEILKLIDQIK